MARDTVRKDFRSKGITDDKFGVSLADGTYVNLEIDGRDGMHDVTDKSRLTTEIKNPGGKLNSYDIDYTNDLDFASGMVGNTFARMISGGKETHIDQFWWANR
jgi:hypothetical protein